MIGNDSSDSFMLALTTGRISLFTRSARNNHDSTYTRFGQGGSSGTIIHQSSGMHYPSTMPRHSDHQLSGRQRCSDLHWSEDIIKSDNSTFFRWRSLHFLFLLTVSLLQSHPHSCAFYTPKSSSDLSHSSQWPKSQLLAGKREMCDFPRHWTRRAQMP